MKHKRKMRLMCNVHKNGVKNLEYNTHNADCAKKLEKKEKNP